MRLSVDPRLLRDVTADIEVANGHPLTVRAAEPLRQPPME